MDLGEVAYTQSSVGYVLIFLYALFFCRRASTLLKLAFHLHILAHSSVI